MNSATDEAVKPTSATTPTQRPSTDEVWPDGHDAAVKFEKSPPQPDDRRDPEAMPSHESKSDQKGHAEQKANRQEDDKEDDGDKDDGKKGDDGPKGLKGAFQKHPVAMIVCLGLIVVGIIAGIAWYLHARHYESTDDAFIDGRPVLVSPEVTGSIVSVMVTDNQVVRKGDLLATIDPRNYKAAVDQAAAQMRQAEATSINLDAQIAAQRAQIEQATQQVASAEAALKFAQDENARYQDLVQKGAGTLQRAQQASTDLDSKKASLESATAAKTAAERQIDVFNAQKVGALAQRDQAEAQKDLAEANLGRTQLRATVDGRVTRLTAAVGALAAQGQSIMIVVPLDVWVTANFKESQLADMRIGQPVDIRIDAFDDRSFPGRIDSIQSGSGTAFSLLPAQNATGNYVKVVQRVPVKITFDRQPDAQLGPGMSVVPRVTVRP